MIVVNLDVMMARRKMSLNELAEGAGGFAFGVDLDISQTVCAPELDLFGQFVQMLDQYVNKFNKGDKFCQLAIGAFCYRVAKYVGAYAASMNGVDYIAFTAGIGENSGFVRAKVMQYLGYLGVKLDEEANKGRGKVIKISTDDSTVQAYVIPTNEELAIARETVKLITQG